MKWAFRIKHKFKTALLFTIVVVVVLGCSFLESKYMSDMNNSMSTMYKDRLIPEAELLHINDNMHSRRLILEKFMLSPSDYKKEIVANKLHFHKSQIDSLIHNYETTFLVAEESRRLVKFKTAIEEYNELENLYLAETAQNLPHTAYNRELEPVFVEIHSGLLALSNIQTDIGQELYHGSAITKGSASSISYLQIVMIVVIALAAQALLLNSKPILPKKLQKFHLN